MGLKGVGSGDWVPSLSTHSNKVNTSDTEDSFFDLHLFISNDVVSTKIYDKRCDLYFKIVNFPLLDVVVPRSTSYGGCIS